MNIEIKRDSYLNQLLVRRNNGLIKIITGLRRCGKSYLLRTIFNLLVVWMLTGLWHGADWNFVLWGLFFAVFLILEKGFLLTLSPSFRC